MLDTTYALPKHTFPPQQEAIHMMVEVRCQQQHHQPLNCTARQCATTTWAVAGAVSVLNCSDHSCAACQYGLRGL
jgi:hypothetical protein